MKYLILAGGSGTRLWPLSRKAFAKQFLNLTDDYSMLQNTAMRVSRKNGKDIFVISGGDYQFIINDQLLDVLNDYSYDQLIVEPSARNTAPAIAFSALYFNEEDVVAVLSSDHHIEDGKKFNEILEQAKSIAADGKIVTLGIVPDSPKTGYGYIKKSEEKIKNGFKVEKFVEKPNIDKAKEYLLDGGYYWNAGIFVFKVKTFFEELKKHSPEIYEVCEQLKEKVKNREKITKTEFDKFQNISIDYALMEKSDLLVVIPSEFGWSDVGSFQSLFEILPKDKDNNSLKIKEEDYVNIDSKNLLVYGSGRKIATINLSDLIIIDTKDALLISDNTKTESVKEVVKRLQEIKAKEADIHLTAYRPWGSYTILDAGKNYQVKQLMINPKQKISLQYHKHRSETWTVVEGVAEVQLGEEIRTLHPSESIFIPANINHRITNPLSIESLKVIEVQTGRYLEEDDIIRLEDDYKRL
ncbi:MAG TPA: mannose-1-phosphate guanylyltransferase/mannose-6-phosphate isomerase [Spirochaetota bacterium]|nr:mannose-1-phosphate guanylyltransferase/mannose-6-phosphate isomerase [Spirochaetota bacterium]